MLPSPSCLLCGLRLSADLSILIRFVQSRSILHVIVLARLEEPVAQEDAAVGRRQRVVLPLGEVVLVI